MNEQLQEALAELLGKANNGIDNAGVFLAGELPEVIQQLLSWHGLKSFAFFIVGIVTLIALVFAVKVMVGKIPQKPPAENGEPNWAYDITRYSHIGDTVTSTVRLDLSCVLGTIFSLFVFIFSMSMINIEWLQIWIAPKVWLIEYAASLTK